MVTGQLKERKIHTHTQQHGRTAATHTAAAGAQQSRAQRAATNDPGVNAVVGSASLSG